MKYHPKLYARAFLEALTREGRVAKDESLIENLLSLMRRNGDLRSAGKIFKEVERLAIGKAGGRTVKVEFARKQKLPASKMFSRLIRKGDSIEERTNPGLVAGTRITIDGKLQFDGSLKSKMDKLFQ